LYLARRLPEDGLWLWLGHVSDHALSHHRVVLAALCRSRRPPRSEEARMKRHRPVLSILFWLVSSLITLFPIYWMFIVSAKSRVELFGAPNFIIKTFFSENYIRTLTDPTFQKYMFNS